MLQTLLFDLDGTLLPLDQDYFTKEYLAKMLPLLSHLQDPHQLAKHLWAATNAMIESNDVDKTNELVFREVFLTKTGLTEAEVWPIVMEFYEGAFGDLEHLTNPTPLAGQIVDTAVSKGYEIVLATNPLFPRAAILHRMRWAGIDGYAWKLITVLEEMHFCKPNIRYYEEILSKIGRKPDECMMIGNSQAEDMIAGELGIQTYLVTGAHGNEADAKPLRRTDQGSLQDFLLFLQELPDR